MDEKIVRWDRVVENYTFRSSTLVPDTTTVAPEAMTAGATTEVRVWLFGGLGGPRVRNPVTLRFTGGCALREVIDEIDRQVGPDFQRKVVDGSGELLNICHVFLDGVLVRDIATPICSVGAPASVEIILFQQIEGG